jgi:hypothetical protein
MVMLGFYAHSGNATSFEREYLTYVQLSIESNVDINQPISLSAMTAPAKPNPSKLRLKGRFNF